MKTNPHSFLPSDPEEAVNDLEFRILEMGEGITVHSHSWDTGNPVNPDGWAKIVELDGRYHLLDDDDGVLASCSTAEEAFCHPSAEGMFLLSPSVVEVTNRLLSFRELMLRLHFDVEREDEVPPGKISIINGHTLSWNEDFSLSVAEDVAPFSFGEAREAIFSQEAAAVELADKGIHRIFLWRDWFWVEGEEEDEVYPCGFRTLELARQYRSKLRANGDSQVFLCSTEEVVVEPTLGEEYVQTHEFWLLREPGIDSLWLGIPDEGGHLVADCPFSGLVREAAQRLLRQFRLAELCSSSTPSGEVVEVVNPGLLDNGEFQQVMASAAVKMATNTRRAFAGAGSAVIAAAKELGLAPQPSGHSPTAWTSACPGHHQHRLLICTDSNEFGCGYCKRKGGAEELQAWVAEKDA